MRVAICGFVAGAGCLQQQAALPAAPTMAAGCAIAVLLLFLRGVWRLPLAGALLGFCWAALVAHAALRHPLAVQDEGAELVITGIVASLPYRFDDGVRFNFTVEQASGAHAAVPRTITLAWYSGYRGHREAVGDVQPGERWQLAVRLQRPHGGANPYGFDYEVWLLEQGVRATGYVRADAVLNRRLDAFVVSFGSLVERSRAVLRARILDALPGKPYAGVIVALVVGDQRAIDQDDWTIFNRTGIGHLISISGLHVTMVAGLAALLASWLWRRSFFTEAQLPLRLPSQKVAALAGAFTALLYVLLAGFGVPAQRTLYMLSVVALALWTGRLTSISHVLCLALGVVVLLDPWAVLAPGFWLSFGAVALILFASAGRTSGPMVERWRGALMAAAHTQYVVTLGLVPLTMLLFSQVSVVSPIANAIAIPLISFVVTPLALAGSMLPAPLPDALLGIAHFCVEVLAGVLAWLGGQRLAVWSAPSPSPWAFALAMAGTVWMLAPRGWPLRWTGAVAWLPLLAGVPASPAQGQVAVIAFDVGQGMALLVETSGHRLLYDTGPAYSPDSNGANRVILPYLKGRGIERLDMVVVSHSDTDHVGGAVGVLDNVAVGSLLSSLPARHPAVLKARHHARCAAGQAWVWDGVRFDVLHPASASYDDALLKPNARSCTLRITAGARSILLAGDIEADQEAQLVTGGAALHAEVLLAPHHGSGTSSTEAFLDAVQPTLALFQVGYRNRYRHPKKEVFERYERHGIVRMRSDTDGAVLLDSADGFAPRAWRETHQRYWYGH